MSHDKNGEAIFPSIAEDADLGLDTNYCNVCKGYTIHHNSWRTFALWEECTQCKTVRRT